MTDPRLLWVLGDSWTDPSGDGWAWKWPRLVSLRLGLGLVNSGRGSAGYVAAYNPEAISFPVQAARGVGAGAALVVAFGSINDNAEDPERVHAGAVDTFRMIRLACPDAPLVVFGPQTVDGPPWPRLPAIRAAVESAARDAGATFVDVLDWLQGRPELSGDPTHPNPDGHAFLADLIAPILLAHLQPAADGPPGLVDNVRTYPRTSPREYVAATPLPPPDTLSA